MMVSQDPSLLQDVTMESIAHELASDKAEAAEWIEQYIQESRDADSYVPVDQPLSTLLPATRPTKLMMHICNEVRRYLFELMDGPVVPMPVEFDSITTMLTEYHKLFTIFKQVTPDGHYTNHTKIVQLLICTHMVLENEFRMLAVLPDSAEYSSVESFYEELVEIASVLKVPQVSTVEIVELEDSKARFINNAKEWGGFHFDVVSHIGVRASKKNYATAPHLEYIGPFAERVNADEYGWGEYAKISTDISKLAFEDLKEIYAFERDTLNKKGTNLGKVGRMLQWIWFGGGFNRDLDGDRSKLLSKALHVKIWYRKKTNKKIISYHETDVLTLETFTRICTDIAYGRGQFDQGGTGGIINKIGPFEFAIPDQDGRSIRVKTNDIPEQLLRRGQVNIVLQAIFGFVVAMILTTYGIPWVFSMLKVAEWATTFTRIANFTLAVIVVPRSWARLRNSVLLPLYYDFESIPYVWNRDSIHDDRGNKLKQRVALDKKSLMGSLMWQSYIVLLLGTASWIAVGGLTPYVALVSSLVTMAIHGSAEKMTRFRIIRYVLHWYVEAQLKHPYVMEGVITGITLAELHLNAALHGVLLCKARRTCVEAGFCEADGVGVGYCEAVENVCFPVYAKHGPSQQGFCLPSDEHQTKPKPERPSDLLEGYDTHYLSQEMKETLDAAKLDALKIYEHKLSTWKEEASRVTPALPFSSAPLFSSSEELSSEELKCLLLIDQTNQRCVDYYPQHYQKLVKDYDQAINNAKICYTKVFAADAPLNDNKNENWDPRTEFEKELSADNPRVAIWTFVKGTVSKAVQNRAELMVGLKGYRKGAAAAAAEATAAATGRGLASAKDQKRGYLLGDNITEATAEATGRGNTVVSAKDQKRGYLLGLLGYNLVDTGGAHESLTRRDSMLTAFPQHIVREASTLLREEGLTPHSNIGDVLRIAATLVKNHREELTSAVIIYLSKKCR